MILVKITGGKAKILTNSFQEMSFSGHSFLLPVKRYAIPADSQLLLAFGFLELFTSH